MSRALAEFGRWCLERMRSPAPGDIDGGEAQDEAERLGLLMRVQCTEPCGDSCACAEYHGEEPWECLRPPAALECPPLGPYTDDEALAAANEELDGYENLFKSTAEQMKSDVAESMKIPDPRSYFLGKVLTRLLVLFGHRILDLRAQLEAARRERDAVADLMDGDMDTLVGEAAREECHGEVPGA